MLRQCRLYLWGRKHLYGVAAHCNRRAAVHVLAGTLTALLVALTGTILDLAPEGGDTIYMIALAGVLVAAWVVGDNLRVRRAYVAAVEDRAARLEREQRAQAQRAVLEERSRIARELHDIVAHSMSVMVVQAGAARRTLDHDPGGATEAISQIETTGRDALAEMRRVVAVLRSDLDREHGTPTDRARGEPFDRDALLPQPTVDRLPALVGQCRDAGLDVTLDLGDLVRPLPSGVELAVYRIVQEALNNTMRHAGAARAEVTVRHQVDRVSVSVGDNGRGAAVQLDTDEGIEGTRSGSGHGLTGMRERVALYGGRVTAGPRAGGGFLVEAEIPLGDTPAVRATGSGISAEMTTGESRDNLVVRPDGDSGLA